MAPDWGSPRRARRQLIVTGTIVLLLLLLTGRSILSALWSLISPFVLIAIVLAGTAALLWQLERVLKRKRRPGS